MWTETGEDFLSVFVSCDWPDASLLFFNLPDTDLKQAQNDIFLYALLMGVLPHKGKCGYLVAGCPTTAVDSNKTGKC